LIGDFLVASKPEEEQSSRPFFRHYEELEELDEEHTLHMCQEMRKKHQETSWWFETYWLKMPQQDSPQAPQWQGSHQGGSDQQSYAPIPIKE
jgi:DNA phosphorothioation-dependent restriction protein DptG